MCIHCGLRCVINDICVEEHLRSDARGLASHWQWEHKPSAVDISTCVATVAWCGDGFHHVETILF